MILPTESAGAHGGGPKFALGQIVATAAAVANLTPDDMAHGLGRHWCGDWGEVCEEDAAENERSLREGFRLLSVYRGASGEKFWIITEHDRSVTTILLPSDY